MSPHRRRAVFVTAVATVLALAVPAGAQAKPPPGVDWPLACVVPDVAANFRTIAYDTRAFRFVIGGSAVSCGAPAGRPVFLFALYRPNGLLAQFPQDNGRSFGTVAGGAAVSYAVASVPATAGTYGVCLIGEHTRRVSCVEVAVSADAGSPAGLRAVMRPIGVNERLVDQIVINQELPPAGPIEECDSCV